MAALADPTRLAIVEMLSAQDRTAGEIANRFPVSGPAISRHLRVLRTAGLVTFTMDGPRRIYRLNPEPLVEAEAWMSAQLAAWHRRYDDLGRHLDAIAAVEDPAGTPRPSTKRAKPTKSRRRRSRERHSS